MSALIPGSEVPVGNCGDGASILTSPPFRQILCHDPDLTQKVRLCRVAEFQREIDETEGGRVRAARMPQGGLLKLAQCSTKRWDLAPKLRLGIKCMTLSSLARDSRMR